MPHLVGIKNSNGGDNLLGKYINQTLSSSIKTKDVIKNNFGMPKMYNPRFIPVNKTEAKDHIYRTISHDPELADFVKETIIEKLASTNQSKTSVGQGHSKSPKKIQNDTSMGKKKMLQELSDPQFASRLDKMEKVSNMSKFSLGNLMYTNHNVVNQKHRLSLYDYQKI